MISFKPMHIKIGIAICVLFLIYYLGGSVFGENGLMDLKRKQAQLECVENTNRRIEEKNRELYRQVDRLKNDPAYLEHVVRQQLCVVDKEELVFIFQSDK